MIRLRTMTLDDAQAVCDLNRRIGLGDVPVAEWRRRWEAYPLSSEFQDIPIGWVLADNDGSIKGAFANVHLLYELAGRSLRGCIGCEWGVESEARGLSLQLLDRFLRQRGADICIVGTASPVTSEILTRLKVARIPAPGYDDALMWAVRPAVVAAGALRRKEIRGAGVLAWPAGVAIGLADFVNRSGRGRVSSTVRQVQAFDERFDSFWERLRRGSSRLRAVRSRAVLAWRFQSAMAKGEASVLVSEREGNLDGYAVLVHRRSPELGMTTFDVADFQALGNDVLILKDLLLSSIRLAREGGAGMLKLLTGDATKRSTAVLLRPHSYHVPLWQMYFKSPNPQLAQDLSRPDLWDFCLFDSY
jgi:hypothetical protein